MYKLLSEKHYQYFRNEVAKADKEIRVISPFIGYQTAIELARLSNTREVKCSIITRFSRKDFLAEASSLKALEYLIESGVNLYAVKDLHAKLYLIDDDFALLGSANFTLSGFTRNHELQIMIKDEYEILGELSQYFNGFLAEMLQSDEGCITKKLIQEEKRIINELRSNTQEDRSLRKHEDDVVYGANIINQFQDNPDIIEIVMNNDQSKHDYGIWLKFEGSAEQRLNAKKKHSVLRRNITENHITSFPRRPTGIRTGDYIYIAAVAEDENGSICTNIVGRARTIAYKDSNVASRELIKDYPWMQHYKYYIELYDVEQVNSNIEKCISLKSMIHDLKNKVYPSTLRTNSSVNPNNVHRQKSHVRITNFAKEYLDVKIDELLQVSESVK